MSDHTATVIVLLLLLLAAHLFGRGKLPRAWTALWASAPAAPSAGPGSSAPGGK